MMPGMELVIKARAKLKHLRFLVLFSEFVDVQVDGVALPSSEEFDFIEWDASVAS